MKRLILRAFLFVWSVSTFAFAQVSQQALFDALLKTTPGSIPSQFSGAHINKLNVQQIPEHDGMIGAMEVGFTNDANAKATFLIFADRDSASGHNRKGLPPWSGSQKLLPYPPMARCMTIQNGIGYCDMWLQQDNAIIKATASSQSGAEALIGMAFKDFYKVKENAPQPQQQPQTACSLLTKSEVEAVLGSVREPEPDHAGGCFFGSNTGDGVTVQLPGTGKSGFATAKSRMSGATALPGVGDDAFAFVSLAGFVQIYLIKHDQYATLIYQNQRDHAPLNAARDLAAKIAGRL